MKIALWFSSIILGLELLYFLIPGLFSLFVKNKLWEEDYSGVFGVFYQEPLARMGLVCESERTEANA